MHYKKILILIVLLLSINQPLNANFFNLHKRTRDAIPLISGFIGALLLFNNPKLFFISSIGLFLPYYLYKQFTKKPRKIIRRRRNSINIPNWEKQNTIPIIKNIKKQIIRKWYKHIINLPKTQFNITYINNQVKEYITKKQNNSISAYSIKIPRLAIIEEIPTLIVYQPSDCEKQFHYVYITTNNELITV